MKPSFCISVSCRRMSVLFTLFLISVVPLMAKPVDLGKATDLAKSFVGSYDADPSERSLPREIELRKVDYKGSRCHIFNTSAGGFVIVSSDDIAYPILGYSFSDTVDVNNMPANLQSWLSLYDSQIASACDSGVVQSAQMADRWQSYSLASVGNEVVSPLITTKWDQAPLYNKFCPYDSVEQERTVTGCVATAMAQVINYHGYPARGFGFHQYRHKRYGLLSADFEETTYDFANMPTELDYTSTEVQTDAVATLMYHCGVSVDMDYNTSAHGGSSAYADDIVAALRNNFGYDKDVRIVRRISYYDWYNYIKGELDASRPVLYSGSGPGGGHSFICDGYTDADYYHIVWGWSGLYDGYFKLEALEPGQGGIGAGSGSYNENQAIVIGIKPGTFAPMTDNTNSICLQTDVKADSREVEYLSSFNISATLKNRGSADFAGEVAVVVYDATMGVFDTTGVQMVSIGAGAEWEYKLAFDSLAEYSAGFYTFAVIVKETGSSAWTFVNDNGFRNRCQVHIKENKAECQLVYKCDFESPLVGWTFETAAGVASGFVVDTAVAHTGAKSLYTSSDGGASMGYTATNSNGYVSVAYKRMYFKRGTYTVDYSWIQEMYSFEQSDRFGCYLFPESTKPKASDVYEYPSGYYTTVISPWDVSSWRSSSTSFTVREDGVYWLAFYLVKERNPNGALGAAIDDMEIRRKVPMNITFQEEKDGVHIQWTDVADKYPIRWHIGYVNYVYDTAYQNSYFIPYTKLRRAEYNRREMMFYISSECASNSAYYQVTTSPFPQDTCILRPYNFEAENTDTGVLFTWSGNAPMYEFVYDFYKDDYRDKQGTKTIHTTDTFCFVRYNPSEGLRQNEYFNVRALCENDTSIWTCIYHTPEVPDSACLAKPRRLYTQHKPDGIHLTWSGNADKYQIECHSEDEYYRHRYYDCGNGDGCSDDTYYYVDTNYVSFTAYDTAYTIPYGVLADTLYHFRIRAICGTDTGFWSDYRSAYNVNFGDYCIPFYDLCGPHTEATTGSYYSPYSSKGVIDYGYKDWSQGYKNKKQGSTYSGINGYDYYRSRHTICFKGHTDPRCDNKLTTVPNGEDYSLRLGNWYNGEGESVTFTHTIDSGYKLILLLKYAVVLQDPSHTPEENPHFTLEILDDQGQLLDSECLYADFAADKNAEGWALAENKGHEGDVEYQDVVWKDWTTIGINLSDLSKYGDKTIKIRLTTKDCTLGKHYGYAYFSLSCTQNDMFGVKCGERPLFFEVPEGFNYKWYLMDDTTKTAVSTERKFAVMPNDTCSYYVDMISKENENCFYTMGAYTLPRMPEPVIRYVHDPSNCSNAVQFTADSSYVYKIMLDGKFEQDYRLKIDSVTWDFGEYGKRMGANLRLTVPNTGDTIDVTLRAVTNNCHKETSLRVIVPAIRDTVTYAHRYMCEGDTLFYSGKEIVKDGVYVDTLLRYTGCDSVHILTVEYLKPEYKLTVDTICSTESPYIFFGEKYTASGVYEVHEKSSLGCDTIIHQLTLTVVPELKIAIDPLGEFPSTTQNIDVKYSITSGNFYGYKIEYSADARKHGFVDKQSADTANRSVVIDIPTGVAAGKYGANVIFYNPPCAEVIVPIEFTIYMYSKPVTDATLTLTPHDCVNDVVIKNNSKVYRYYSADSMVVEKDKRVDSVRWNFGKYGSSGEMEPVLTIPAAGDTLTVSLTSYYGEYSDSKTYDLQVPSITSQTHYIHVSICEGDSYVYEGKTYNAEGEYVTSVVPNEYGCDSTTKLVIRYLEAEVSESTDSVCRAELPYDFYGQKCSATGAYTHVVKAVGGCDSLIYKLNLVVLEPAVVTINSMGEICADDESFTISYQLESGMFSSGSVVFGTLAKGVGFEDMTFEPDVTSLKIMLPDGVRPDNYDGELVFDIYGCETATFPFKFTVLYSSSVIGQRWNDFLSVKNANFNGGYTFSDCQWLLNDAPVDGYKSTQLYNAGEELDFEGEYRVLLTREGEDKAILSCPFTPIRYDVDDYTDMNTLVYTDESVVAKASSKAKAQMYNSVGVKVADFEFLVGENPIAMPSHPGVYTLTICYESGRVQNIKIVVRE